MDRAANLYFCGWNRTWRVTKLSKMRVWDDIFNQPVTFAAVVPVNNQSYPDHYCPGGKDHER
jgi:hypothetical protein